MYHEQLVKHNNLNTKMNLHNDDDNVNDGDMVQDVQDMGLETALIGI